MSSYQVTPMRCLIIIIVVCRTSGKSNIHALSLIEHPLTAETTTSYKHHANPPLSLSAIHPSQTPSDLPPRKHWCPANCECFNGDDTVDCSRAGLTEIPHLRNTTKRLYLEDNRVSQLSRDAFLFATNLCLLVVERNELTTVDVTAFCGLTELQELGLSGNQIRRFVVDPLGDCRASGLKELDLSLNLLRALPLHLVQFSPNLEILNLSFNEIESVAMDASYAAMTSLRYLDLSRNRIHALRESDLRALNGVALEILNLAECGISVLEPGALSSMGNLTSLSLSGNAISPVELAQVLETFAADNALARLDISEISLPNLTVAMLGHLDELVVLDAAYCDLELVEPEVFDRLADKMESLHLEGGKLRQLDNLAGLRKLRRLHLQENQLEVVNLRGILTLESLDISHNRLKMIPARWLTDLRNLQILNLSHNHIKFIEADAFNRVNVISTLDISFNALESVRNYGLTGVVRLYASHNVITSIEQNAFVGLEETLNEIDLSENQLSVVDGLVGPEVESRAETRRPFEVRILNLAHNNLGKAFSAGNFASRTEQFVAPRRLFQNFPRLELLDLSHNEIIQIDCDAVRHLANLNQLNLRDNNISDLRSTSLWCSSTLAKLYLSGNQLSVIDVDVLTKLPYLEEVDFSENPFTCDCGLLSFLRWVNDTNAMGSVKLDRIFDLSGYQCSRPVNLQGTHIFSEQANLQTCVKVASRWQALRADLSDGAQTRDVIEVVAVVTSVVGLTVFGIVVVGAVVWKRCRLRQRIKIMKYRWQIRYREVSDLETAADSNL